MRRQAGRSYMSSDSLQIELDQASQLKGNDAMLALMPIVAMHFPGTGIQENLAEKAKKLRITAWRFGKDRA